MEWEASEPFFGVDPNISFVCLFVCSSSHAAVLMTESVAACHRAWLLPPGLESWFAQFWTHLTSMQPVLSRTSVWLTCAVDRRTEYYMLSPMLCKEWRHLQDICKDEPRYHPSLCLNGISLGQSDSETTVVGSQSRALCSVHSHNQAGVLKGPLPVLLDKPADMAKAC